MSCGRAAAAAGSLGFAPGFAVAAASGCSSFFIAWRPPVGLPLQVTCLPTAQPTLPLPPPPWPPSAGALGALWRRARWRCGARVCLPRCPLQVTSCASWRWTSLMRGRWVGSRPGAWVGEQGRFVGRCMGGWAGQLKAAEQGRVASRVSSSALAGRTRLGVGQL